MIASKECAERGCACHDPRVDGEGVEMVKREWVGLTDIEKSNLWLESRAAIPRFHTYATLVETKLKEKNTII